MIRALGLPNDKANAAEDFVVYLCAIGNHMESSDKRDNAIGEANAMAVNHTIGLDLAPTSGRGSIILMKAPAIHPIGRICRL